MKDNMKDNMKMKDKDTIEHSQFTQKLNDLLNESNYSKYTNKLFNDLALPPGFYIKPIKSASTTIIYNHNNCSECIDDKTFSELLKSVKILSENSTRKHKKSTNRKTKSKKHKK